MSGKNTTTTTTTTTTNAGEQVKEYTPSPLVTSLMATNANLSELANFSIRCAAASVEANGKIRTKCYLSGKEVPMSEAVLHGATVEAINPLLTSENAATIDSLCKQLQAGEQVDGTDVANLIANLYRVSVLYSASAAYSLVTGSLNAARSAKRSEDTAQVQREVQSILTNLSELSTGAKELADSFGK